MGERSVEKKIKNGMSDDEIAELTGVPEKKETMK